MNPQENDFNEIEETKKNVLLENQESSNPLVEQEMQNPTSSHVKYYPESESCESVETVIPASMSVEQFEALKKVGRRVNGVDEYVRKKLKYPSIDELCKAFSAEQVDALALSIYNMEAKNLGCIIGDQTGVGKGRVAGGIIAYAKAQNLPVIFMTEKPNLFSDIYRDLIDINQDDAIPLYIKSGEPVTTFRNKTADELKEERELAIEEGRLDEFEESISSGDGLKVAVQKYSYSKNKNYESQISGAKRIVPFIVNGKEEKTKIKDKTGNVIYEPDPKEQKKILGYRMPAKQNNIINIQLPEGKKKKTEYKNVFGSFDISDYDVVLITYSQLRDAGITIKKKFFESVCKGAIVVMDESHNSSGEKSNTGVFLQAVLKQAKGCVFLSATYAKRPDNMTIYAQKTSMQDANMAGEQLVEAIKAGGVPLQEILSAQLVSEGQYVRRERSFEGIEVNYYTFDESIENVYPNLNLKSAHEAISNDITNIVRLIMNFQKNEVKPALKKLDEQYKEDYKEIAKENGVKRIGIDSPAIFSGVFNLINQILLSIKAEAVAELAIERMNEGKKPVIAFANTMESFLNTLENEEGEPVKVGDVISTDFSHVLMRRLNSVLKYNLLDKNGDKIEKVLDPYDQNLSFQTQYKFILSKIKDASVGLNFSPLDVIRHKIEEAGYSVAEVTGRSRQLKILTEGSAKVETKTKRSVNDLFREFNENKIDCLMINQSGSTGASAHSKPNDVAHVVNYDSDGNPIIPTSLSGKSEVKQRVMIILQPELNINTEVQKRGRINRVGQVFKPIYDYATSAIPAEKRLMMMLKKKLKSLDANTTSNQKQTETLLDDTQEIDFLNKYGDEVAGIYLKNNPTIDSLTGNLLVKEDSGEVVVAKNVNLAYRVSGRVAILDTHQQNEFYGEMREAYIDLVNMKKQMDEYDLEVSSMNLQAEVVSKAIAIVGKPDAKSVFGRQSILEKCEVNNLRKPFKHDQVKALVDEGKRFIIDGEEISFDNGDEVSGFLIQKLEDYTNAQIHEHTTIINEKYDNLLKDIEKEKAYKKFEDSEDKVNYIRLRTEEINEVRKGKLKDTESRFNTIKKSITSQFEYFKVGRVIVYNIDLYTTYKGLFVGFDIKWDRKNPFTPSSIKLKFALIGSLRYLTIPMSKYDIITSIQGSTDRQYPAYRNPLSQGEFLLSNWNEEIKKFSANREIRYIVTGNILQALGETTYQKGKLIRYTLKGGGEKKGVLMPTTYDPESTTTGTYKINVPITTALPVIQNSGIGTRFITNTHGMQLEKLWDGRFKIEILKKGQKKSSIAFDTTIHDMTEEGKLTMVSGMFRGHIKLEDLPKFAEYCYMIYNTNVELNQNQVDELNIEVQEIDDVNDGVETIIDTLNEEDEKLRLEEEERRKELERQKQLEEENEQKKYEDERNKLERKGAMTAKIMKLLEMIIVHN